MKIVKTVMVVQSSTTGKILLKRRGDVWGFVSENIWSNGEPMLFNGLKEIREVLGLDDEFDDMIIDFVGTASGVQIFHCVFDNEPVSQDPDTDWCSLFHFPEKFDCLSDKVFEHRLFLEKIVSPNS